MSSAAAFLAGAGEQHYFVTGGWHSTSADEGHFATHWVEGLFDRPLGAPLSDAEYNSTTGDWTRTFAKGTKVLFNAVTKKGSIAWGS